MMAKSSGSRMSETATDPETIPTSDHSADPVMEASVKRNAEAYSAPLTREPPSTRTSDCNTSPPT